MNKKTKIFIQQILLFIIAVFYISIFTGCLFIVSASDSVEYSNLVLNVGSDETSVNVTWYSTDNEDGVLEIAKKSDMSENEFPSDYISYEAETTESSTSGEYINKLTITDLESDTEYVYRFSNGEQWSDCYYYTTQDIGENNEFSFIAIGDAQIGCSEIESDTEEFAETLSQAVSNCSNASFILSVGDQVENSESEEEYSCFLSPSYLTSIPLAPTIGNHDYSSTLFNEHFNLPNTKELNDSEENYSDSDYYYIYNNTLFIDLNTNNSDIEEHTEFMEEAIADNPDVNWIIVVFHHSIYSVAGHVDTSYSTTLREELSPVLYDLGVDVVIMGHDHVYARSYIMGGEDGTEADVQINDDGNALSCVTDPDGVLYVTLNSSSGSKYYDITNEASEYTAVMSQDYTTDYSIVDISENSFTIATYNTSDGSLVDEFTIYKTESSDNNTVQNNFSSIVYYIIIVGVAMIVIIILLKKFLKYKKQR